MWDIFRSIGAIDKVKQKGSIKYYKEKLDEYQENEAEILVDMGLLYYDEEKYDESIYYLKKAVKIYSSLFEIESEAFVHDLIGDVYLSQRKIDEAIVKYEKALNLYSNAKSSMKDEILEKIKEVEDIKQAIELADEAKINEEIEKENFNELNDDKEENQTEEYDQIPEEKKEIFNCHLSYEKISSDLESIMKIISKKYNLKEPSKAEYETGYFQKSVIEAQKNKDHEKEVGMLQLLGNYLMKEDKPYSAMQNLKTAYDVSHKNKDKEGEAFSLLLLGVLYYLLGKESMIYDVFKKSLDLLREIKYKKGEKIALDIINTLYNEDECSIIENTSTP
ncbi:MAG TPA: tetratricopeptide repeat protein [Methanobacterium sp.]|nr:tetratricopeptide repeat protein [Methanobacterium sp.]